MQRATAVGLQVDPRAERLEHVGRARQAGGRAVAVLGHRAAGAGGDQRRGGRDVERAAPAAGAGGVEQVARAPRVDRRGERAHRRAPGPRAPRRSRPSCAARSGTPAIWVSEALPAMISARTAAVCSAAEIAGREASASIARVSRFGHLAAHRGSRVRKLREQLAGPAAVSTDSGWNWTPSAGSSRWRTRHHHPAADGAALEHVRQRGVGDERVVAARPRAARAGRAKIVRAVVLDRRSSCRAPARGVIDRAAARLRQRLVAEADAERRDRRPRGSARTASSEMPASFGVHGPGETITRS